MMIARHVRKLEGYVPGEQPKSRSVVKLNTNENPYPPSPKCAEVLKKFDLDNLRRYPDPDCTELRKALAKFAGAKPEQIFVGNGSDEILALCAKTFVENDESIGSLDPSYSLYKTLAAIRDVKWVGAEVERQEMRDKSPAEVERQETGDKSGDERLKDETSRVSRLVSPPSSLASRLTPSPRPLSSLAARLSSSPRPLASLASRFTPSPRSLSSLAARLSSSPRPLASLASRLSPSVSLFLLTNPNAPTGEFREPAAVARFAKAFRGVVLVDEAYADFARDNCMSLATDPTNRNVIVMRTFSKSFSLAGLRVGWCVGPKDLIDALYKMKDSYNVDAVAQRVALAAVRDAKWMRANVKKVIATRARVTAELTRRGWDVIESESNFLFAKPPRPVGAKSVRAGRGRDSAPAEETASAIFNALRARNIFVRYFRGPKTGDRLRVTIGTDSQMNKFLKAIDEIAGT